MTLGAPLAAWSVTPAMIRLEAPPEMLRVCRDETAGDLEQRMGNFWKQFERLLYTSAAPPEVGEAVAAWADVHASWKAIADAAPGAAREAARAAWRSKLAVPETRRKVLNLSSYQLTLMRCFFPGGGAGRLDATELTQAFEALAKGTYASRENPMRGRMDDITGWIVWASYAEAAAEVTFSLADRDAWRSIERMALYGVLVHAHYDSRPCPGNLCQQRPGLMPRGLRSTALPEIQRFAAAADVNATVTEVYTLLKGSAPTLADRLAQMAQMYAATPARTMTARRADARPTEDELREKVAFLEGEIADLKTAVDTAKRRLGYVVLAFFRDGADFERTLSAYAGRTSGLPSPSYNWDCNPCRKYGNQFWTRTSDPKGEIPEGMKAWRYVAARRFASGHEAAAWLQHSEEGKFISDHADAIMTTVVTDYDY
jgi:hypothetical protein